MWSTISMHSVSKCHTVTQNNNKIQLTIMWQSWSWDKLFKMQQAMSATQPHLYPYTGHLVEQCLC